MFHTYVVSILSRCYVCLQWFSSVFQVFLQMFRTYVTSVFMWMLHMFHIYVTSVLSRS
jgi:hypothetical protein